MDKMKFSFLDEYFRKFSNWFYRDMQKPQTKYKTTFFFMLIISD